MKVTLINCTPYALEMLLFTRSTRLQMDPDGLAEVMKWPEDKKRDELEKLRNTIQSSWEFIDYIFVIKDVTRAFTHQLVRHRVGTSFAQQAQRVVDMSGFTYETGPSIADANRPNDPILSARQLIYDDAMLSIKQGYHRLIEMQTNPQDARGVLPTNIHTNIIFKANLRTLHDMGLKRLCVKTQGEFQDVFRAIREEVIRKHPWAKDFIKVNCAWNGTCCFPTFPVKNCPIKAHVYDPTAPGGGKAYNGAIPSSLGTIETLWESNRAEAQPVIENKNHE